MAGERLTPSDGRSAERPLARLVRQVRLPAASRLSAPWRYAIPLAATLLAFLIQLGALPHPSIAPFVFFYVAVVIAAWFGGRGPGLLAVALSAAVANHAFVGDSPGWATSGPALTATALFVVAASVVALLCSAFRDSEKQQRRQRQLLETLLNHAKACVAVMQGRELRYTMVNRAYQALRPEMPMLGRTYREVFPEAADAGAEALLEKVLETGELVYHSAFHAPIPGKPDAVWNHQISRLPPDDSEEASVLVVTWDMTDRMRAERASAERLRKTQELAHLGSWELDLTSNRLVWSDEVYRIFGLEPREFGATYEAFLQAVHPDDRAAVDSAWAESLREGTDGYEIEHRIVRKSTGEVRIVHEKCEHQRDASGRIVRSLGMVHDITERKQAEERARLLNESLARRNAELDAERTRWQGVVEGIAEEVWVCDAKGMMSLINLPDRTTMGLEEFESKTVQEVLEEVDILYTSGEPRPPEEAPLLRSLRTGGVVRGEEIMRHRKTGKMRYRHFSCAPTRDAAGAITGAVAIVRDITQNKQIEQALREADQRKNEFLAMLSHELRNPLAPIRNSLYILDRSPPGGDQARRALATIDRQVDHLTRLVGDLLDLGRITRGRIELRCERLDLCELVTRTVEDHRPLFAARGIEVSADGPDDPVWVDADATRLAQALGNVLQNAVKFTPAGGRVFVHMRRDGPSALLAVRDTGAGISPEIMARLFEPFTQADRSLDRRSGGLGLGLALVKGLVALHGGEVHAASEGPGRGAEITIRLPAEIQPPHPAQPRLEGARAKARRVLVIEDNVDAAESLKEALELEDHRVAVAYTGPEGLARARAFAPDIVLCDIGLPGMDGYDVARAFRSDEALHDIALVALTGYAAPEDQRRAASVGFDHHLAKPPDMDAIGRILAEIPGRPAA